MMEKAGFSDIHFTYSKAIGMPKAMIVQAKK
jgi:hypothetical protein